MYKSVERYLLFQTIKPPPFINEHKLVQLKAQREQSWQLVAVCLASMLWTVMYIVLNGELRKNHQVLGSILLIIWMVSMAGSGALAMVLLTNKQIVSLGRRKESHSL